jgi:hypothetical protein
MLKVNQKNEPPLSQNSLTHVGAVQAPCRSVVQTSAALPLPTSLADAREVAEDRAFSRVCGWRAVAET